jgi:cyclin G-associated kinase
MTCCGDLTISMYHARNALGGIGRTQGLKIAQFQLHTGYIPEEETLLHFNRTDLDDIADGDHIPKNFSVHLSVFVSDAERLPTTSPPWIPAKPARDAKVLFASQIEYEENVDNFSEYEWYWMKQMRIITLNLQSQNRIQ